MSETLELLKTFAPGNGTLNLDAQATEQLLDACLVDKQRDVDRERQETYLRGLIARLEERLAAERAKVAVAEKLADALRTVIYGNALEECDCLAGVEALKEWNALRECAEGVEHV